MYRSLHTYIYFFQHLLLCKLNLLGMLETEIFKVSKSPDQLFITLSPYVYFIILAHK